MAKHYWAVRPKDPDLHRVATRIEHAETALQAYNLAFGRGSPWGNYEAKDLGGQVRVIQSDRRRIELLTSSEGWVTLGRPLGSTDKRPFSVRMTRCLEQVQDIEVWATSLAEAERLAHEHLDRLSWPDDGSGEETFDCRVQPKEE